jgi:hypothetical protein
MYFDFFDQMCDHKVVGDSTDPKGTQRPNIPPPPLNGTHFIPLETHNFTHTINLPLGVNSKPFAIWDIFFPIEQLAIIVENTNKNGQRWPKTGPYTRKWKDICIQELYTFFAIIIYMGIHIENDIESYWKIKKGWPIHTIVHKAISCNRWQNIARAFHLSNPSIKSSVVFEKVLCIY